jgi:RNA-directed DNA polymerase
MRPDPSFLEALASAFLSGELTVEGIVARCARTLGWNRRWLRQLARRYVKTFSAGTRPRRRDVVQFLLDDRGFRRQWSKYSPKLAVEHWLGDSQRMQPVAAASRWEIPAIESVGALAEWLGVDVGYLKWFADLKGLGYKTKNPKLGHYHYRILAKDSGDFRLIEAPKQALKKQQQRILGGILDKVPSHAATHGFVKGRSIKTYVTPHAGRRVVLRMDLRSFFTTFRAARIQAFFRTLGYPESVAELLAGICTNATPRGIWKEVKHGGDPFSIWEARILYARPHLPQGAPTSPALANLCAYRLDCRLEGLARSAGAQYTRYADDLAFSGDQAFERLVERFSIHVAAILREEGFAVHHRKTRIMRQGVRQRLVGLVANQRPNTLRSDFDRLKATLTNCARLGPETQNREAHPNFRLHLKGRVSFVETINPAKGRRLRAVFEKIKWEGNG